MPGVLWDAVRERLESAPMNTKVLYLPAAAHWCWQWMESTQCCKIPPHQIRALKVQGSCFDFGVIRGYVLVCCWLHYVRIQCSKFTLEGVEVHQSYSYGKKTFYMRFFSVNKCLQTSILIMFLLKEFLICHKIEYVKNICCFTVANIFIDITFYACLAFQTGQPGTQMLVLCILCTAAEGW